MPRQAGRQQPSPAAQHGPSAAVFAPGTVSFMPSLSFADGSRLLALASSVDRYVVATGDAEQRVAAIDDMDRWRRAGGGNGLLAGAANAGAATAVA